MKGYFPCNKNNANTRRHWTSEIKPKGTLIILNCLETSAESSLRPCLPPPGRGHVCCSHPQQYLFSQRDTGLAPVVPEIWGCSAAVLNIPDSAYWVGHWKLLVCFSENRHWLPEPTFITTWACDKKKTLFTPRSTSEVVLWVSFLVLFPYPKKHALQMRLLPFISKLGTTVKAVVCWMLMVML